MIAAVFAEIKNIQTKGVGAQEVQDIKEALLREYETQSQQNAWVLTQLEHKYRFE